VWYAFIYTQQRDGVSVCIRALERLTKKVIVNGGFKNGVQNRDEKIRLMHFCDQSKSRDLL